MSFAQAGGLSACVFRGGLMKTRRNDIVLILCILAAAAVIWGAFALFSRSGAYVLVTVDGEPYGEYSLKENRTVQIVTDKGENSLCIENGRAYISSADCPDLLCVRQGGIEKDGESIVCLPHRVIVTVSGGEVSAGDAVSR